MKNLLKKSTKLLKSKSLSESRTNITTETETEKSSGKSLDDHECDKDIKMSANEVVNSKNLAANSNTVPSSLIPMTEEDKERLEIVLFNQQLQGVGLSAFMIDIWLKNNNILKISNYVLKNHFVCCC